jgi:transglutaminase-like putative cysteine protease
MIYDVKQVSSCTYTDEVPFSRHVARLMPREWLGQRIIAADLSIDPKPADDVSGVDFFGNRNRFFTLDKPHSDLTLTLKARISVEPVASLLNILTPPWEEVRDLAQASSDLSALSPVHHLFDSRMVHLNDAIGNYAAESFPSGRPIMDGANELMRRIWTDFTYKPGATDVDTLPEDAFDARKGVCQDFAHIMIAGLRWLGLPAAYVSGFLRTLPPPGQPRLEGADATHAWASVWCGSQAGWIGFDPTNDVLAGEDHILIAFGRDYADVSPLDGVIVASGDQSIDVAVDVVPVSGLRP